LSVSLDEPRPHELAGRPEMEERSAAGDAAIFTAGVYAAQLIQFVAGLIQKGILGAAGAGYWALMQSFWTFMSLTSLGAFHGATRQIPLYRGRGDLATAATVASSGNSFSILASAVAGVVLAGVALVFGSGWEEELRWGVVLLGLTAPLRLFQDCHETLFQSIRRFRAVSVARVVKALVALTFTTLFVVLFGFYGMFAGTVVAVFATQITWNRMGLTSPLRPAFGWRVDWSRVRELISFGAPILIVGQLFLLFVAIDSLLVAQLLGIKELGYYALAVSVTAYIVELPKSFGAVVFPRMTERFGATSDIASIRHLTAHTQQLLAFVFIPVFMAGAVFAFPVLIRHALPEFEPAIEVVSIMVGGSFCLALTSMPTKMLLAAGYRWVLSGLELFCIAISAAANYTAMVVLDWGLNGAALATSASYLVLFVLLTVYALSKAYSAREVARHMGELLAVLAYVVGAIWGLESLAGPGDGLVSDVALALAKFVAFLVLLAPWVFLAQRRFQTLTTIRRLAGRIVRR
jgi:O-antigen/teichoic acid export membrane protein